MTVIPFKPNNPDKKKPKVKVVKPEAVAITTEYIRLDSFMKLANLAATGGEAKFYILGGDVKVNGETCTQRGRKLRPGDKVKFENRLYEVEG